jgi:hypothetical protein
MPGNSDAHLYAFHYANGNQHAATDQHADANAYADCLPNAGRVRRFVE